MGGAPGRAQGCGCLAWEVGARWEAVGNLHPIVPPRSPSQGRGLLCHTTNEGHTAPRLALSTHPLPCRPQLQVRPLIRSLRVGPWSEPSPAHRLWPVRPSRARVWESHYHPIRMALAFSSVTASSSQQSQSHFHRAMGQRGFLFCVTGSRRCHAPALHEGGFTDPDKEPGAAGS